MSRFSKDAGAALVFAILYALMFIYMTFMYATKRYRFKSRFTILYFHALIRVASQACGVAFGILVWKNLDVFVAFLILSAEGYFSLTIAAYYFLKHYEIGHLGSSNLGPAVPPKHNTWRRIAAAFSYMPIFMPWKYWHTEVIAIVDSWLIPANAIIIAGGSLMVNANAKDLTPEQLAHKMNISKALRTTGQAIFLALTVLFGLLVLRLARRLRRTTPTPLYSGRVLSMFGLVAIMLAVRGIFGVLQAADYSLSYYNPENYDGTGFTDRFIALEYCLTVVTEFTAACTLNLSYWGSRHLNTEERDRNSEHELNQQGSKDSSIAREGLTGPSKVEA